MENSITRSAEVSIDWNSLLELGLSFPFNVKTSSENEDKIIPPSSSIPGPLVLPLPSTDANIHTPYSGGSVSLTTSNSLSIEPDYSQISFRGGSSVVYSNPPGQAALRSDDCASSSPTEVELGSVSLIGSQIAGIRAHTHVSAHSTVSKFHSRSTKLGVEPGCLNRGIIAGINNTPVPLFQQSTINEFGSSSTRLEDQSACPTSLLPLHSTVQEFDLSSTKLAVGPVRHKSRKADIASPDSLSPQTIATASFRLQYGDATAGSNSTNKHLLEPACASFSRTAPIGSPGPFSLLKAGHKVYLNHSAGSSSSGPTCKLIVEPDLVRPNKRAHDSFSFEVEGEGNNSGINSADYRKRRERNNIAVRRSREKAKQRVSEKQEELTALSVSNSRLKRRCDMLEEEVALLRSVYTYCSLEDPTVVSRLKSLRERQMKTQNAAGCVSSQEN